MDAERRDIFIKRWGRFFSGADLPVTLGYSDSLGDAELVRSKRDFSCLVGDLARVRRGRDLAFDQHSILCGGGKKFSGFSHEIHPDFEHFLSCGIPGKFEGERYKKTPELVRGIMRDQLRLEAPGNYLIAKRWDRLTEADDPDIVVFFSTPDVLSGLFTLANFDEPGLDAVWTPFAAGCAAILHYPFIESLKLRPRSIMGMFDVTARPSVPRHRMTFAVPMEKFLRMVNNMEESFLITPAWSRVRKRIRATRRKTKN